MRHFFMRALVPVLLLGVFICIISCGGCDSDGSHDSEPIKTSGKPSWTYMVYMAADNNISNAAFADINEMESVGSSNDVNIVVQAEFNPEVSPGLPASTIRGKLTRDDDSKAIGSWYSEIGNKNMADPATLTEFITWAAQNYPASNYALVLWSHGSGWKSDETDSSIISKGMIMDTAPGGGSHRMSLPSIASAVGKSDIIFEVINFDSCLMGMYEVAYEFKGLATYLAFSEDVYPVNGDPYDIILGDLVGNPAMDGAQLVQTITGRCMGFYQDHRISMTRSSVSVEDIDQLHIGICTLARYLSDHMSIEKASIESARTASVALQYPEHHDLGDFLKELGRSSNTPELQTIIRQLQEALSKIVFSNEIFSTSSTDKITDCKGIAIYLPSQTQVTLDDLDQYSQLSCNRSFSYTWGDLVNELVTGTPAFSSRTVIGNFPAYTDESTGIRFDLNALWSSEEVSSPGFKDRIGLLQISPNVLGRNLLGEIYQE